MKSNFFGSIHKESQAQEFNNIIKAPVYNTGALNDIYKNPLYHTIRSNIATKQSYLINHFHDMTFVASCSDYAFVLSAPFKTYAGKKTAEEREKRFQDDKAFTKQLFKKNIEISHKLDAKEKSRAELFKALQTVYPTFGLNMDQKIPKEDYELVHRVRKNFRHVFSSEPQSYDPLQPQNEKLLSLQDKLSEVIDSENFAKACNIEDKFMISEIDKFLKLYSKSDPLIARELTHETLLTHDGRKVSPIALARKIRHDRVERTHKYAKISQLYKKLGSGKEIKILTKPNDDYEK